MRRSAAGVDKTIADLFRNKTAADPQKKLPGETRLKGYSSSAAISGTTWTVISVVIW